MKESDYRQRDKDIIRWRKEGVSQAEMARRLKITRQRVQQIERRLGLGLRRVPGEYKRNTFKCKQCGKESTIRLKGRVYCSRKCFFESRKIQRTPEEKQKLIAKKREQNRLRSQKYYHEVFKKKSNWREIVKQRNQQYAEAKKQE